MSSEETKEPHAIAVADKNDEASNGAETGANQAGDGNVDSDKSASNVVPEDPDPVGEEDHEDPLVIDEAEERSDGADSDEKVIVTSNRIVILPPGRVVLRLDEL